MNSSYQRSKLRNSQLAFQGWGETTCIHWFLGGKGLSIQQGMGVWVVYGLVRPNPFPSFMESWKCKYPKNARKDRETKNSRHVSPPGRGTWPPILPQGRVERTWTPSNGRLFNNLNKLVCLLLTSFQ